MVTGDVVNAAARLQSLAEPGTVVAGERTRRAARGFRFEDPGPEELKGKPIGCGYGLASADRVTTAERGVPGLRAPMVGRDAELDSSVAASSGSAADRDRSS